MDMNRNPNLTPQEPMPAPMPALPVRNAPAFNHFGFGPGTMGVSRKEFIRLTHGEFKSAGREPALVAELQQQIDAGQNCARRVLAQVRLHQGQRDAALALELDFIQHADFDALTVACRRGLAYEEFQQTAEAGAEFEKALAMKPAPVQLPDGEERFPSRRTSKRRLSFQDSSSIRSLRHWPRSSSRTGWRASTPLSAAPTRFWKWNWRSASPTRAGSKT